MLGEMTLQDSSITTYNTAAFNGSSISALTGANSNVSLTYATTDGAGDFDGGFDQNNNGNATSVPYSPGFTYTYAASSANTGRYTFQMLGTASAASPLNFVLYASANNSGYLLESDTASSVMTGVMVAQPNKSAGAFVPAGMPGTYGAATFSNSLSSVAPLAFNLLLTSPGNSVFNVNGTENPGNQTVTGGAYSIAFTGTGAISVTTGSGTANYVLYAVDSAHFFMMRNATMDTGVAGAILFAAE
jgi:hypothetical protein